MVLLVLALIWGALLVSWLRSRSNGTFSDSVGTFRRHLTVLERTTPMRVHPANRLHDGVARYRAPAARRPAVASPRVGAYGPYSANATRTSRPAAVTSAALRRRQARKRRRDIFFALVAGTIGAFGLALITGLAAMWAVQVLFDLFLGSYVALLIRLRNLAAERELKLRFMPADRPMARPRRTYDFGAAGYGELELRRAVN